MLTKELMAARRERGLTQKMVADLTGLHQAAYSNIEKGKRKPSVRIAKRIGEVLGVDWTIFFADEKSE